MSRCWVLCCIGIKAINTIICVSLVFNDFCLCIFIYFYLEAYSHTLTMFYPTDVPSNRAIVFNTICIRTHKRGMCWKCICDFYIPCFTCRICVRNLICQDIACLYTTSINGCCCITLLEYILLWLSRCIYSYRFRFNRIYIIQTKLERIIIFCTCFGDFTNDFWCRNICCGCCVCINTC